MLTMGYDDVGNRDSVQDNFGKEKGVKSDFGVRRSDYGRYCR
jgi:hypothetical protein